MTVGRTAKLQGIRTSGSHEGGSDTRNRARSSRATAGGAIRIRRAGEAGEPQQAQGIHPKRTITPAASPSTHVFDHDPWKSRRLMCSAVAAR